MPFGDPSLEAVREASRFGTRLGPARGPRNAQDAAAVVCLTRADASQAIDGVRR